MELIDMIVENIKALMRRDGIDNPTRLAALMEEKGLMYSQPNLSRLLGKKYKTMDLENIILLAKFFDVSIDQIVGMQPLDKIKSVGKPWPFPFTHDQYIELDAEKKKAVQLVLAGLFQGQDTDKRKKAS